MAKLVFFVVLSISALTTAPLGTGESKSVDQNPVVVCDGQECATEGQPCGGQVGCCDRLYCVSTNGNDSVCRR